MATSLSLVGVIWTVLSLSATLTACVGYFMPYWLSGDMLPSDGAMLQLRQTSFGTYRRCGYSFVATKTSTTATDEGAQGRRLVSECGRYRSLWDIPSVWWQATTVLVGAGCCVAIVVASAGLLCCCVSDAMSRPLGVTACLLQLTAGGLIAVGCLLYPLGWDNAEVLHACTATAHRYSRGSCRIGWAYWTTVCGGAVMVLCSWLACYASKRKNQSHPLPDRV